MNFLTPLALSLAALLPVIVALYFLKLRREERRVSSTYLWRTLVRDTAANAPWQRLKPNLLLLLQLLFLIALILALARPFIWSESAAGSHLILIVDTSASMGATDVPPTRLAQAVTAAWKLVDSLPSSTRVTLIEAGAQVRIPVSGASDRSSIDSALASLRPVPAGADFASALTLAAAMAAREPDSEVVILSDGHVKLPDNAALPTRVRYIPIGKESNNQAIGAFSLQPQAGGTSASAFVQVANYSQDAAERRLVLMADDRLVAARDLKLDPGESQAIMIPDLPAEATTYQARLEGPDALPADDRAWAVSPSRDKTQVRIIGPGNRYLETALHLLPNVQVVTGETPISSTIKLSNYRTTELTIFDSTVPTGTLPSGSLLLIAPLRSTEFFSVTGRVDLPVPAPVTADDPVARYVDLHDVAIQDATRLALPSWGHAVVVDSKTNAPLLIVGEQDGRRLAVLAFDLRRTDLPLRVAFPILMTNLVDYLVPGGVSGIPAAVPPGTGVNLAAPPQATALTVRLPDGQVKSLAPSNGQATFDQTNELGVYEVASQDTVLGRFAVNLFDPNESDIAPRATLPISSAQTRSETQNPKSKMEWWRPLAWLAFVLLIVEWMYAHRGQVVRLLNLSPIAIVKRKT